MAETAQLPSATLENIKLEVVEKFKLLNEAAMGSKSFYMRAKDTIKELFSDDKNWSNEYAKHASELSGGTALNTTHAMAQLALEWATREKELNYSLALTKANIELVMAQRVQAAANITNIEKDTDMKSANLESIISSTIRENGRVMTYDVLTQKPTALYNEGLKWVQIKAQEANTFSTHADTYRKSGIVTIGIDTNDGLLKGTAGDNEGYTYFQQQFAIRQTLSFEDSKRNHAANASSAMLGQMLSQEIPPAAEDVARWRTAVDYLNTTTPTV